MRCAWPLALVLVLLGGCKREPTFEERYEAASKTIVSRAKQIDVEVAATEPPPLPDDADGGQPVDRP